MGKQVTKEEVNMKEEQTVKQSILNIGAGKIDPTFLPILDSYFLVNLDIAYENERCTKLVDIERRHENWKTQAQIVPSINLFSNKRWEDFFPSCRVQFGKVVLYRFLEHVRMTQVLFFIYLMSTVIKVGGTVDVIVPNYEELANLILEEDPGGHEFEAHNILTTTELLNEPEDPHASIWTPNRVKYFFELEGRFKVEKLIEKFEFDGRDIYMWFQVKRV